MTKPAPRLEVHAETGDNQLVRYVVRDSPKFLAKKTRRFVLTGLIGGLLGYLGYLVREWHQIQDIQRFIGSRASIRLLVEAAPLSVYVIPVLLLSIIGVYGYRGAEDSMVVIKEVGIQLDSKKPFRLFDGGPSHTFIPSSDIIDLVIHEGFHGYGQVIFYMCILTKNADSPINVVFPQVLPRHDTLLEVRNKSRQVLFGKTRFWRRVPGQGLKECD